MMALFKLVCWAIIFLTKLRFPPDSSIATNFLLVKQKYGFQQIVSHVLEMFFLNQSMISFRFFIDSQQFYDAHTYFGTDRLCGFPGTYRQQTT